VVSTVSGMHQLLRRLRGTPQVPRPHAENADPAAQAAWTKGVPLPCALLGLVSGTRGGEVGVAAITGILSGFTLWLLRCRTLCRLASPSMRVVAGPAAGT
jgi:Winged helix-turn helix